MERHEEIRSLFPVCGVQTFLDAGMSNGGCRLAQEALQQRAAQLAHQRPANGQGQQTQLALLHKGGIVFESDIQNLKTSLFKVQVAFKERFDRTKFEGVDMLNYTQAGSVATFIARGDRDAVSASIRAKNPLLLDVLPLNLEEVFIYEMEALGYAFKDILM